MPETIQKTVTTQTPNTVTTNAKTEDSPPQTLAYFVYFLFGILEILLVFRFILRLTGANPGSEFVSLTYCVTRLFILPFLGIFPTTTVQGAATTGVFEPATLVAIFVYAAVSWGIVRLIAILSKQSGELG